MQRKLEATAAEAERLKCEVADLSGTAAASAAATAKRSEALQKMVSSRSYYRVTILHGKKTSSWLIYGMLSCLGNRQLQ